MSAGFKKSLALGAVLCVMGLAAAAFSSREDLRQVRQYLRGRALKTVAESEISDWPADSKLTAHAMMARYGPPDEARPAWLAWADSGEWLKTVVRREALESARPGAVLEQSIRWEVSEAGRSALTRFGCGVSYDPLYRSLTARSDAEKTNYLAMNLALEVAKAETSPAAAGALYDRMLRLQAAGKESPLLRSLVMTRLHADQH